MNFNSLSQESKDYVDRYIRCSNKTREQALQEKIVQNVVEEYEKGVKSRIFV